MLAAPPERIDIKDLNRFPSFQQFRETQSETEDGDSSASPVADMATTLTPDEVMRNAHHQMEVCSGRRTVATNPVGAPSPSLRAW